MVVIAKGIFICK